MAGAPRSTAVGHTLAGQPGPHLGAVTEEAAPAAVSLEASLRRLLSRLPYLVQPAAGSRLRVPRFAITDVFCDDDQLVDYNDDQSLALVLTEGHLAIYDLESDNYIDASTLSVGRLTFYDFDFEFFDSLFSGT